jgi:hypothetical protein
MAPLAYIGYKITDTNIASKLEPLIGEKVENLREEIYTVKDFCRDKNNMLAWYKTNTDTTIIGYLKKIYINQTKKTLVIVGEIAVNNDHLYITFVNDTNISLQSIKAHVNKGSFGEGKEVDPKVPIEMKKIIYPPIECPVWK